MVIPGAVSQKRRDYERVLKSIQNFRFPSEIIFLGKASEKNWIMLQDFEQSKPENISIKYFTEKVPQDILMIICKKQMFCGAQFNKKRNFSVKRNLRLYQNEWKH